MNTCNEIIYIDLLQSNPGMDKEALCFQRWSREVKSWNWGMDVCCLWCYSLCIIHFPGQHVKRNTVLAKQKTLTNPIQSYPLSLSHTTTQNPGKPLWAWCAQLALGDNQWCQDPIQTDCALRGPWAEVSFVAPRSGLNSAIKYFGDVKQITVSLHCVLSAVPVYLSDFGVESAWSS